MDEVELTTTQVAARLKADARLIRLWCQQGRFKNARQVDTPRGAVWLIPESDLQEFEPPKMGRPPKAKTGTASKIEKKKGSKK